MTSREHLYAAYGCNLAAGQRISFLTVLAPQAPGTAALPVDQTNAVVGPDTASVTVNGYNFSFKTVTDSGGPQQCVFSSGDSGVLDDGSGNTVVGTTPPVLAPIGNRTVLAGNPVTFTVSATAAVPTQTLTYSLDAGAPAGATIDPSTGVFSWVTSGTQSAGAYPVTIRVTNNATAASSASETITITVTSGSLAPWLTQDIGAVGLSGSTAYVSGTFQVIGAGADIFGTADAFRYVYQLANGDCSITARVTGISNTSSWAKAGVMIRNTLDANSANAMMHVSYSNGTQWQYRPATGSSSYSVTGSSSDRAPYWVRVTRAGNVFTGYRSADGVTWVQVGASQTIPMNTAVYIGLAVSSHSASLLNTSTFTNISTDNAFAKPVITAPSNMTVEASSTNGTVVNFSISATDWAGNPCNVSSIPASGSMFPLGTTTVTVTASDAAGNNASQTFTVTVTSLNVWTGATGTAWETLGNWSAAVPTSSDVAVFAGSLTNNQPSITGSNSVAGMLFESPGWTLNSASSGALTIGANGVVVDANSGSITLNKTVTILAGTTRFWKGKTGSTLVLPTVPGAPTGTTNLQWGDAADPTYQGTLKLTFTGLGPNIPFIVSGGTLEAHKTGWINSRDLTVNGGTFLVTNSDGDLIRNGVTLNSGLVNWGGFNEALPSLALNGGTLRGSNSTLSVEDTSPAKITVTGDITLGDAVDVFKLKLARSGSTGICDLNGGTHTLMVNSTVEFALPVTNGNLIKQGAGTLILSSTAALSGETAISGGTLEVDGTLNLSDSPQSVGAVTVNSGATLSGTGTINGPVTVGGNLTPGVSGTGTLRIANSLTFSADSITTVFLRRTGTPNCTGITGATSVALNGTLTVVSTSGTLAAGDTFVLFNASAYSGSFSAINLPTLDAGLFWNTGNLAVNGSIFVTNIPPLVITVPSNITVEAAGPAGSIVSFSTSALDAVDGAVATVNNPASGSTFPLGTTTVTVTASSAAGNNASQTFAVTVRDTTPPAITAPSNMTVEASGSPGAVVTFATSATDTVNGARPTVATPASGSTFPLGTTTVTVTASDAAGNTASKTFTVTVQNTPAPGGFSAGPLNGAAWLFWNGVTGANSYTVKRSTVNGGPYTAIATGVTSTAYTDSGLTNGTTYYYVVSAVTNGGETVNSVQASATPSASASNFTNSNAGAWSTAAWLPNPPGKPTSDSATSLLFNNNSAISSTNDMGAFSLNSLTLGGQGVSLTGDPLILSGTAPVVSGSLNAAHSIGNAITLDQDTTFAINSSTLTLNGVISGTHALTKTGSGALRLGAANSYSGNTILSGGTLACLVNNSVPSLIFGVTGGDANVSALDLSLASLTANNLTVQTNSSGTNAITIGSGKALTVNGGFGMDTAISGTANMAVSGGGAMAINGPGSTFMVGVTSDSNIRTYSLDMSGLSGGFTANVANFYVGRTVNTYNYIPNATVKLAPNSSITAANFEIGSDAPTGNGGVNTAAQSVTVTLASGTNYLKATSATVGRIKGGVQTLNFAPGSGTLILSGTDGASALGTMYVGYKPHTGSSMDVKGVADFSNGIVTGSIGSLYVGHMTSSQGSGSPKVSGTLTLGASGGNNLVVTALNIGTFIGSTIPTSSKYPGGTVTMNGGFLTAGSVVMTSEQYGRANLNINGGAVTINGDITASTSIYTAINLNGGTLDMTGGAIGSATNAIATLNFQSGTLMNVAQINNGAGLTKSSTGTLTLAGINTYTGATVVSSGTLQFAGSLGSGGSLSVNAGGVLIGSGTLGSPVTVSGQIAPGVSGVGALRVNNTLTLNAGSLTAMTIDRRSGVAATQITGISTLTYSGTLTVSSLGGTLAAGDTFVLFNASAYSGSFSAINLPTLDAGLAWNTSNLAVNGSISVKDIAPPAITVPSNITAEAAGAAGSIVAFNTSALDAVDGAVATVNSPVTGSTFPIGTTTVTVTASDAAGNAASKTFTITVTRSFAWFQGAYGLSGANPAGDAGHGLPYLTAYAFGMNPNAPDRSLLPSTICQNGFLQITYLRYTDASDLTYVVEVSGDLHQWNSGSGYTQQVSVTPIDASRQQVVERDLIPTTNAIQRFIRVRVVK